MYRKITPKSGLILTGGIDLVEAAVTHRMSRTFQTIFVKSASHGTSSMVRMRNSSKRIERRQRRFWNATDQDFVPYRCRTFYRATRCVYETLSNTAEHAFYNDDGERILKINYFPSVKTE